MKHENYEILNLLGYGLSKFNMKFIRAFGYKTKQGFYDYMVSLGIAETGSTIKNRQDLFDPFFDNGRKGWWQKGDTYIHRKHLIDSLYGDLSVACFADIVKLYLVEKFGFKVKFKQLQSTGLEAELFFQHNFQSVGLFANGNLEDARLLGDGYDYQITLPSKILLAEVKGVRKSGGAIRLTEKEYKTACHYKEVFTLVVISQLSNTPKITVISDPVASLKFTVQTFQSNQINYHLRQREW
jgi:hypothetical protein